MARSRSPFPRFVSTLCICIVFLPMFFLSGVAKYLFVPLAEAVVFAMLASYSFRARWSRRWRCICCKPHDHVLRPTRNPFVLLQRAVRARLRAPAPRLIELLLTTFVYRRFIFVPAVPRRCACCGFLLFPWLGQDFFPTSDNGQFRLHLRARTGTRIEETARLNDLVDQSIRRADPARRTGQHRRQHRVALQRHQHHLQHQRRDRLRRRRHSGFAQGGPPSPHAGMGRCAAPETQQPSSPAPRSISCPPT